MNMNTLRTPLALAGVTAALGAVGCGGNSQPTTPDTAASTIRYADEVKQADASHWADGHIKIVTDAHCLADNTLVKDTLTTGELKDANGELKPYREVEHEKEPNSKLCAGKLIMADPAFVRFRLDHQDTIQALQNHPLKTS
jgi:hypothetical protein